MKKLDLNSLEVIQGGEFVDGLCAGIAVGDIVYAAGLYSNWWNPVGWVSGVALGASAACAIYVLS